MKIINRATGETIYAILGGETITLDEALDLVAPDDWREQLNTNLNDSCEGFFSDNGSDIYYDDLDYVPDYGENGNATSNPV